MKEQAASRALAVVLLSGVGPGCTAPPATGTVEFVSPSGGFALRYVAPPWRRVRATDTTLELQIDPVVFGVEVDGAPATHVLWAGPADAVAAVTQMVERMSGGSMQGSSEGGTETDGGPWGEAAGTTVEGPAGTGSGASGGTGAGDGTAGAGAWHSGAAVALFDATVLLARFGGRVDVPPTVYGVDGGVFTYQVVLEDPPVFVRSFYWDGAPAALRVAFVSLFDLRTADIDAMVATVETRSGGG